LADFRLVPAMRPTEGFRIGIKFGKRMETGDTATTQVITAKDYTGADVSATFLTQPSISAEGLAKVKLVKNVALAANSPYTVTFHITTTQGDDFEGTFEIPVKA
jgi:hypothetical protein